MRSIMHTLPAMALTLTLALTGLQSRAAMPDYVTPEQTYQLAREARTERNYPAMLEMLRLAAEAARSFVLDALKSGAGVRTGHGAGPLNHGFSPKATVFRELANPS